MKEKKERGKYKQYLFNKNINVPKTSKWRAKKDKESQSTSNQFHFTEEQIIESTNQHQFDPNLVQKSKEIIDNSSDDLEFESENENENTNVISSAEFESENENDNQNDDSNEEINEELNSFILNKEISKEELEAAYLAAFYNGATTQKTLTDFLQLSNLVSSVKLPTTFTGLTKITQLLHYDIDNVYNG